MGILTSIFCLRLLELIITVISWEDVPEDAAQNVERRSQRTEERKAEGVMCEAERDEREHHRCEKPDGNENEEEPLFCVVDYGSYRLSYSVSMKFSELG